MENVSKQEFHTYCNKAGRIYGCKITSDADLNPAEFSGDNEINDWNTTVSIDKYAKDEQRWCESMARAQRGDRGVYETLLAELASVIEAYLRLRFGSIDMLEDCVQECLIAIHNARHTYNPGKAFRPWMFTIVRHRMIDLLRKRNCRIQTAAGSKNVELDLTDPEHIHRLIDGVRVLESLKPDYREAVTLTKYAGMTTLEASRWLGISESAIKARLRRGLSAIQRQLDTEESMA